MRTEPAPAVRSFPLPVSIAQFPRAVNAIRAVEIDGKPWFVAADVCKVLGLEGYTSQHTQRLPADEKLVISCAQNTRLDVFRSKQPTATLVSEPGLYALIARSDKPAARAWADEFEKRKFAEEQNARLDAEVMALIPAAAVGAAVVRHKRTLREFARKLPGVTSLNSSGVWWSLATSIGVSNCV